MQDLERALSDIGLIREQLAHNTEFRGYAPGGLAVTGIIALLVAGAQSLWIPQAATNMRLFVAIWAATAALCVALSAIETVSRSRRTHGGLAAAMLQSALDHFMPAMVAGGLVTVVFFQIAPQTLWMLPGLWHVFFSLGVFASRSFLPRRTFIVGVWYLACGLVCLALAAPAQSNSAWAMGITYGVGHLLTAVILANRSPRGALV
jgi:hypothetical protein